MDYIGGHIFALAKIFVRGAVGGAEGKIVFGRKCFRKGYRPYYIYIWGEPPSSPGACRFVRLVITPEKRYKP